MTIVRTPNIRSGNPRVKGTRVEVRSVYYAVDSGRSKEEVAEDFDISVSEVEEALEYARNNKNELREIEEKENEFLERHADTL